MDTLTNAEAARLLGVGPSTVSKLSHRFRLVQDKVGGRIQWRADIIRKASEIKAQGEALSVEKLIERAIATVEG